MPQTHSPEEDIPEDEYPPEELTGIIIPPRRRPADDNGYFEMLAQAVFQAGFSWRVVRDKWPGFQRAFDGFDIEKVARYDFTDIERLLADPGIIRNGRKIEAVIANARVMQGLIAEHGSFYAYLRTLDHLPYEKRKRELARRFRWLGRTGVFCFLWCVDEEVPDWEDR
jgi:3-methyladenine DNA glycosylase Tag